MSPLSEYPRLEMAKEYADKLTTIYSAPLIPVLEIAQQNGANVVFTDFAKRSELVSGYCDFRNARLYVNCRDIPQRQSFAIAHELGHWLIHKGIFLNDPEAYSFLPRFNKTDSSNALEREANRFAANLLVPERLLRPLRKPFASASALADLFYVSRTMMEIRLRHS